MENNSFEFVKNETLRTNLRITLSHVFDLLFISERYRGLARSSFIKTTAIYVATITEALLLWMLKQKLRKENNDKVELKDEWRYIKIQKIYEIQKEPIKEVIACIRERERKKIKNLDFFRISRLCLDNKIINKNLFSDINKVRKIRNRLHIGSLDSIERGYSKKDLNFCMYVLDRILSKINLTDKKT